MIYKTFQDKKLSALGMGCMRFPILDNDFKKIDEETTAKMFDYAIQNGVNYFDTAYVYHGGQSEYIVGKLLKKYPRESYYIADKFPGMDLTVFGRVEEIFEEQLQKVGVEYFDFYLFHCLCENNIEHYLDEDKKYGTYEYLIEQKRNGRIHHLGFSAHAELSTMRRFLEKYGKDMEFCQLQINWLDWTYENAKAKVELLQEYNIPVWVMEPVRGGRLASLQPIYEARLKALRPNESVAAWAFRFLQTKLDCTMVLSGMSNFEQVQENVQIHSEHKPLSEEELRALDDIVEDFMQKLTPCTGCRYCVEHCPQMLDIPNLLNMYNEYKFSLNGVLAQRSIIRIPEGKRPSDCLQCRACEGMCPQKIRVSEELAKLAELAK
ncbi:MAG: aldo/keto reductase [Clostridia bacterium]|nr:aldo/keto reductase [Clostridia bacterium]